jgi:hypothetical protein
LRHRMIDHDTDTTDEQPAVPPAQPDVFGALMQLLHLIGNASLYEGRLKELRKLERETARSRIELVSEQAKHAEAVAKELATIVAARDELVKRQTAAMAAEAKLAEAKERIAEFNRAQRSGEEARRFEQLPGGGVRDWGPNGIYRDDAPRARTDPVYDVPRSAAIADETEIEHVAPSASTLTRSVPKPRKSMRRVSPNA